MAQFNFKTPEMIQQVRNDGLDSGFAAFSASVFIANPWAGVDSEFFEAWGDGYELGVLQARSLQRNMGWIADNDNE